MEKNVPVDNQDNLRITCAECGKSTELDNYEGWSFIILKEFFCNKCQKTVKEKSKMTV